jgi:hypothetical protein
MDAPGLPVTRWRKSSRSGGEGGNCVELAHDGRIRDSKNAAGPTLTVDLGQVLAAAKAGQLDRLSG